MRVYTVTFENVSVSAAQDFFEISPADDKPITILGLSLDNVGGTADAGDAQEELLRVLIRRGHTVSGSGGSAPTPRPTKDSVDTAAGFAAEVNNTTIANTGTTHDLDAFGWNVRVPLMRWFPPEMRLGASQADTTIVVRLLSTPADAISMSGTLWVAEGV
jgi:hypothetical protein